MRKVLTILLIAIICIVTGCADSGEQSQVDESINESSINESSQITKYKITFTNMKPKNQLASEYSPGEIVTIQLDSYTEHYYVVKVNGEEIREHNWKYGCIYYSIVMPDCDATIHIDLVPESVSNPSE